MSLLGKKVLLFSPCFFNYEKLIANAIEAEGGIVHLYDERNNPSSLEKILLRKVSFLMSSKINKFYKDVCVKELDFQPDYIFFISPETVNKKSIINIKESFPKASLILYMYDSIENKNAKKIYNLFDSCFSFDPKDCNKYKFNFRPLFFCDDFEKDKENRDIEYKFSFIGSIHSDRAKILNKLRLEFESKDISFYYYLFVPGKLMLFIRMLLDRNIRQLLKKDMIHLKPIDKKAVSEIARKTLYTIDINHPKQVGLTMRTIEMLGLQRKMLTTNMNIANYDFYRNENQIIIDRNDVKINFESMSNEYKAIDDNIYDRYNLETWIKDIFSDE